MSKSRYGYCKIFVKHPDPGLVLERVAELFDGQVRRRTIELPGVVLDIRANPDVSPDAENDFVRWPVLIEAEPDDPDGDSRILPIAARIITHFWENKVPTVTASDFEDELPWNGGINRIPRNQPGE